MNKKVIYLAGGCFWGMEEYYRRTRGVIDTRVGYANGVTKETSYYEIAKTLHAETVKVVYNSDIISLREVLTHFFAMIDPVSYHKQGGDIGSQYRTGIFYVDIADLEVIKEIMEKVQKNYTKTLAVEVLPLTHFVEGEEYHQKYLEKNPQGYCHIKLPPKG